MDPAEGLARLERMGQRARARRAQAEAEERARQAAVDREHIRAELRRAREHFLAGPPGGCALCYAWGRLKFGWDWFHVEPINPVLRPVDDEEPEELCEWCTHGCHGPDGLALPIIALAGG